MFKCTVPIVLFLDKTIIFMFFIYIIFTGFERHIDNLINTLLNLKMYWKRLITSKSISGTVLRKCRVLAYEVFTITTHLSSSLVKAMHSRGRHNNDQTCNLQFAELLHSHAQCSNLKKSEIYQ